MNIKTKLLGIISIFVMAIILIGGSSVFIITSTMKNNDVLKDKMEVQKEVKHIQYRLAGLSNDERGFIITGDQQFVEGMNEKAEDIFTSIEGLRSLVHKEEYLENIEDIQNNFTDYWSINQQVVDTYTTNPESARSLHFGEERSLRKEVLDPSVNELVDQLNQDVESLKGTIQTNGSLSQTLIIMVTVASILIGVILSIVLLRSILLPLRSLTKQFDQLAHGDADLTKKVMVKTKDEFGQLASSFNAFLHSLTGIVKSINDSSEQVAASSEELSATAGESTSTSSQISESMHSIARRSTQQWEMTEKSSASIHELLESTSTLAANTNSIATLSTSMREKAEVGSDSVHKMVSQMNFIDHSVESAGKGLQSLVTSTTEISDISSLITEISEQTNLLALNAAIEAARAGEHGKGFAVVTEEVRKLADQSNQSANHIKNLVGTIQQESVETENNIKVVRDNVRSGLTLSEEATGNFTEILDLVEQVSSQIQEVAATTQQLTSGVEVVQQTIDTLAVGTKETSAGTEEISASVREQLGSMEEISHAAESLSKLAEELQGTMNRFKY
ncbi:HAMP domain-containing protein [Bacillus sp. RO3]|nr:HAMP domain-containing protein [Bacillus sp. RO3]